MRYASSHPVVPNSKARLALLAGIAIIVCAMLFGPMLSPPEFNWQAHSTSEQAGQHMDGAWIMRAGFVAYGLGVVIAAAMLWRENPWVNGALFCFGGGLLATAIWSNAPVVPGLPADMHEDWLHSIASGVVGTAFAAACAASLFAPGAHRMRLLAALGLVIAVAIPLAMNGLPEWRGLLQRAMFAYSFIFVWKSLGQP
ncbi:DUF998 domain-containing protein [Erythrobacter sp. GH1-10]|uniref:DUF998 domain-containing protein n=1 Tax=Erythrobacter sp. GH1-10 TaxID=3349334 RepID=UPI003877D474